MKKHLITGILAILWILPAIKAQVVTSDPSLPLSSESVVITFDATLGTGGLQGYTGDVYAHTGALTNISTGPDDWRYVKAEWGENVPECKMTRVADDLYTLEITPSIRAYYGVPEEEEITHFAFVFRSSDTSLKGMGDGGTDILVEVFQEGLDISVLKPETSLLLQPGAVLDFEAVASEEASLSLFMNGDSVMGLFDDTISHTLSFSQTGDFMLSVQARAGELSAWDSVFVHVMSGQRDVTLPDGMKDGINYTGANSLTLVLHAPGKESVFVIGDFNNWTADSVSRMFRDGERFWLSLSGLEAGKEYGYQYLVDEELRIADSYAELILDPKHDQWITEETYPGMMVYPAWQTSGIVSVFQTAQTPYSWKNEDFNAPPEEKLLIYELLLRDFIEAHDWKTLTDTLDYLEGLGINAIELMPVNEFEGNLSWGYGPHFYFAPDKYYGPAEDLKVFVDSCHGRGIAVIIDMVLNHAYYENPMVQLFFEDGKPTSESPWFNVVSPNPVLSWGYDFDHESEHTKTFVDRVNTFWLEEYKVDGFRFDFSKGFTNKPGDGGAYDASRIVILKRMYDQIRTVNEEAYVILEHFADNNEEKELSGHGMLIWGNHNSNYQEACMGYNNNNISNFSGISYKNRGWTEPRLVGYMESHDEERLMYKCQEYGASSGSYNIKDQNTALQRAELAGLFFFTIPGPKMIWQFGELGYDYSIFYGSHRTDPKPIRWDYYEGNRKRLYEFWSALMELKIQEEAFSSDDFILNVGGSAKRIEINHADMDVRIIGNFDVHELSIKANFNRTGRWYEYFSGDSIEVSDVNQEISLKPGAYRLFSTKKLKVPVIEGLSSGERKLENSMTVYPNPVKGRIFVEAWDEESTLSISSMSAREIMRLQIAAFQEEISLEDLPEGMFILRRSAPGKLPQTAKILK